MADLAFARIVHLRGADAEIIDTFKLAIGLDANGGAIDVFDAAQIFIVTFICRGLGAAIKAKFSIHSAHKRSDGKKLRCG